MQSKNFIIIFLISVILIIIALYMQFSLGLEPCPLCIMQRFVVIFISIISLLALVINIKWFRKLCALLIFVFSVIGIVLAVRQLWLQSLPADQVPVCGPGIEYMLENFPLREILSMILSGSGECAEVQWTFLWLSIPGWSVIFFSIFVCFSTHILVFQKARRF